MDSSGCRLHERIVVEQSVAALLSLAQSQRTAHEFI